MSRHLGLVGLATQDTVDAMEEGVSLAQGPASYVFLGQRLIRGWAIEIVLVAMLLPFLAAAVDLFARCRRRRISIAPALRSYRSRLGFWVWVGAVFLVFDALGFWGRGGGRPPSLTDVTWPGGALIAFVVLAGIGWIVAREPPSPAPADPAGGAARRLQRRAARARRSRSPRRERRIRSRSSSSCRALHVWLWLPQVQDRQPAVRASVLAAGFARSGLSRLVVRDPLRARLGRAVVHRQALRDRVRTVARCS